MKIQFSREKYICYFLFILLLGCTHHDNEVHNSHPESISIIPTSEESSFDYSTILEGSRIVKLETKANCLIGRIDKIQIYNGRIYILDQHSAKSLFVFTDKGDFLFKIKNLGRGPGEFLVPQDFWIDTINQEILIADNYSRKILRYDSNGTFILDSRVPFNFTGSFAFIPPDNYFFDIDGSYNNNFSKSMSKRLIATDEKYHIKNAYLNSVEWEGKFIRQPFKLYTGVNGIVCIPKLIDTIYYVTKTGLRGKYFVDFGTSKIDVNSFTKSKLSDKKIIESIYQASNKAYNIFGYIESKDYIFFKFLYDPRMQQNYVYYSKRGKDVIYFNKVKLSESTLGLYTPMTSYGEEFVFVVEPNLIKRDFETLINSDSSFTKSELKEKYEIHISSIKDEDNPILIFCTFNFESYEE